MTTAAEDAYEIVKLEMIDGLGFKLVAQGPGKPTIAGLSFDSKPVGYPLSRVLPTGRWVEVTVDLILHPTEGEIRIVYDGEVANPALEQKSLVTQGATPPSAFHVGLWTKMLAAPCSTLFDDVVVDLVFD